MLQADPTPAGVRRAPALSRRSAFWMLAATLGFLLFASSAPSPLYVVYQAEWGFSAVMLTGVFAVYALALLGALLVAGSVSDHVGRRPTLLVALAIEIAAMALFAEARGVGWLFAARVAQGIATGLAIGTLSAALIDMQPPEHPRRGALIAAAAPLAGLALGALAAGVAVQYGPAPTRLIYWLLVAVFAAAALAVWAMPETVPRTPGWARTLRPRVAVPVRLRASFLAAVPCMTATWALGGLLLSLGPSLTAKVIGDHSHVAAGLSIFVMSGVSALALLALRDVRARDTERGGLLALIAGVALALLALAEGSMALFLAATLIAGMGFGPAFAGAFRSLSASASADRRAALISAIFIVSYLAFSLPALLAGAAVAQLGLHATANIYGAVLMALAALALVLSNRLANAQPALAVID